MIERCSNLYCVPADHPAPEQLRHRLDDVVSGEVLDACRRRLAILLDNSDTSVWLIREIRLELAFDAGFVSDGHKAHRWGELLAHEIRRVIDSGADGDSLLCFSDRAAYIAQWARDMSSGGAWNKWYYRDFKSLRSLPTGAAIVQGIIREPEEAQKIVMLLASSDSLERVLAVLCGADAATLYRNLIPPLVADSSQERRWVSRLLSAWNGTALSRPGQDAFDALRLFAAARAMWPEANESGLRSAIDGLLLVRGIFKAIPSAEQMQGFLAASIAGARDRAGQIARNSEIASVDAVIAFAERNFDAELGWASLIVSVLRSDANESRRESEAFLSEFGGIFLLGYSFVELRIHDALLVAAEKCGDPSEATFALLHLLAIRCLGAARAFASVNDQGVRLFSGLESKISLAEMLEVLHSVDVEKILPFIEELAGRAERSFSFEPYDSGASAYFSTSVVFPEIELDPEQDRAWARIAQIILSHFGSLQPGFSRSTPEYLYQNFIAGTSAIHVNAQRIDVRLLASPLSLVLRMSGAYRTLELPWLKGKEVCLRAPSQ